MRLMVGRDRFDRLVRMARSVPHDGFAQREGVAVAVDAEERKRRHNSFSTAWLQ
jgi:hypothetical protein